MTRTITATNLCLSSLVVEFEMWQGSLCKAQWYPVHGRRQHGDVHEVSEDQGTVHGMVAEVLN